MQQVRKSWEWGSVIVINYFSKIFLQKTGFTWFHNMPPNPQNWICHLCSYSSQLLKILAFATDKFKIPFAFLNLFLPFAPKKRRRKEFPKETVVLITVQKNGEVGKDQIIWNTLIFVGNLYLLQLVTRKNWGFFGVCHEIERRKKRKPQSIWEQASRWISGCLSTRAVLQISYII